MGIVDEDIQRVRDASDIVAIVSQHCALKRVGRRWQGLCPFHGEKSPSFSVNAEQGFYYCFGCHAKGDVITFVREIEHLDFVGAVESLATRAGVTLRYTDKGQGEGRKRRTALLEAMEKAVEWYHQRLLTAEDAGPARSYLRSRGIDGDAVRHFRLGWSPEAWEELAKALRLPDDVWRDSGLGTLNSRGRQTDFFRGRLMFPISDVSGDPVAFGARILPGGQGPKYKNSAESAIYLKSKVLYGLHWAKNQIVQADRVIVCEGYTDVIGFAGAGMTEAVATCGTALTEEHLRNLRRFTRRIVLAFDADAAGQNAAERVYEWERSHDLEVAVAALPAGVDPADLARTNPLALAAAVDEAIPFLGFRLERVLGAADMSAPERRARAAEQALAVVAEHPDPLVRDQYLMMVADRCRLDPERLREVQRGERPRSAPVLVPERRRDGVVDLRDTPELEALRMAVLQPEDVAQWLDESLFDDEVNQAAFRALAAATTLEEAIAAAEPVAADLLHRLAVEDTDAEPSDVVARLVHEAAERQLRTLERRAREAAGDDVAILAVATEMRWVKPEIERLREPETRLEAIDSLLGWLGTCADH